MARKHIILTLLIGCGGDYAAAPTPPNLLLARRSFRDGVQLGLDCPVVAVELGVPRWQCQHFRDAPTWPMQGIYMSHPVPSYWVHNPRTQVVWRWVAQPERLSWLDTGETQWMEGAGVVGLFRLEAVWPTEM